MTRDSLIEELKNRVGANGTEFVHCMAQEIADFILERDSKLMAPLESAFAEATNTTNNKRAIIILLNAIEQTLKLAEQI